jgi:hypothetical protein
VLKAQAEVEDVAHDLQEATAGLKLPNLIRWSIRLCIAPNSRETSDTSATLSTSRPLLRFESLYALQRLGGVCPADLALVLVHRRAFCDSSTKSTGACLASLIARSRLRCCKFEVKTSKALYQGREGSESLSLLKTAPNRGCDRHELCAMRM